MGIASKFSAWLWWVAGVLFLVAAVVGRSGTMTMTGGAFLTLAGATQLIIIFDLLGSWPPTQIARTPVQDLKPDASFWAKVDRQMFQPQNAIRTIYIGLLIQALGSMARV